MISMISFKRLYLGILFAASLSLNASPLDSISNTATSVTQNAEDTMTTRPGFKREAKLPSWVAVPISGDGRGKTYFGGVAKYIAVNGIVYRGEDITVKMGSSCYIYVRSTYVQGCYVSGTDGRIKSLYILK